MDLDRIEVAYKIAGFLVFRRIDNPGKAYEPERHGEVRIYTIKGSAKIRLDNRDWQTVGPGQEIIIRENQLHEAVVGAEGWEYLFATTPEEAKRQNLV